MRRLRKNRYVKDLVAETVLSPADMILPQIGRAHV